MKKLPKPQLFEGIDDDLLNQMPANYRLMEGCIEGGMELNQAECQGAFMSLEPFFRPMSRVLVPREEDL